MTFEAVDLMECSQSGTLLHVGVVERVLITLAILFLCAASSQSMRGLCRISDVDPGRIPEGPRMSCL